MNQTLAAVTLMAFAGTLHAQTTPQPESLMADPAPAADAPAAPSPDIETVALDPDTRRYFRVNSESYNTVSVARGISMHKPMYVFPASYSPQYDGAETEFIFQISAKYRLFGQSLYFGYTQKSFWQVYNQDASRPFRETNYNPEIFYRFIPDDPARWRHWGADLGLEHESNGEALPLSRSWNRLYFAAFRAEGKNLLYLKTWYRIPDPPKKSPDDPKGDDNPDIYRYYGYGEIHYSRQIGNQQVLGSMIRGNPRTGRGGLSLTWSAPNEGGTLFYAVSLWHGYGESLIDYDNRVTRLSFGIMLSR